MCQIELLLLTSLILEPLGTLGVISVVSTVQSVPAAIQTVEAVEGLPTELPCDITPPNPEEKLLLVLWYRQDEGEPIYSYDTRVSGVGGRRWSDEVGGFGGRAYFRVSPGSPAVSSSSYSSPSALTVKRIAREEAGIYRCRVDFKTAPTRNSHLNLTVIVPPSTPTIYNESGHEASGLVGPYMVGEVIVLKCITSGGDPLPEVTWWRDSHLLDSTYESTYRETVQNTLTLPKVTRTDLGARISCQAKNNDISLPARADVTIDLKFRPSQVKITNDRGPLSAGKKYTLECAATGSRPAAVITWYKNGKFVGIDKTQSKIVDRGNVSLSTFVLVPKPSDQGKTVTCRAENTEIANTALEDKWKLLIHHAPIVHLSLGTSLEPSKISEGNHVYFDCKIKASPEVYKIVWLHNDVMVRSDPDSNVLITESSLVIQGVTRRSAGVYACVASNLEGDTPSNPIELKVMFKPICANYKMVVQGVAMGRTTKIHCPVQAHPRPTRFFWTFNNSAAEASKLPSSDFTWNATHSRLRYQPVEEEDFGVIRCFAENVLGTMETPCEFKIIPAGPPDPPSNCSVANQTTDSLVVECLAGFDGGLRQEFVMQVIDLLTAKPLANDIQRNSPEFVISGLNSGRGLNISIYAQNSAGKSIPAVLEGFTLKVAELQLESPVPLEFTPVLGILIGVVATLVLVVIVIFLVLRSKYYRGKHQSNRVTRNNRPNPLKVMQQTPLEEDEMDTCLETAQPDDKDAEEYFCLTSRSGGVVVANRVGGSEEAAAAVSPPPRPPPSDSSDSGYHAGSGEKSGRVAVGVNLVRPDGHSPGGGSGGGSSGDRTPPYMPTSADSLPKVRYPSSNSSSYMMTSPTTAPSPSSSASVSTSGFAPRAHLLGATQTLLAQDPQLYARMEKNRAAAAAAVRNHPPHLFVNPQMGAPKVAAHDAAPAAPAASAAAPPEPWMPLLLSRRQQESTL